MHFLGVKWTNDDELPYFSYRAEPNKDEALKLYIENNKALSIKVSEQKFCIGCNDPCPSNSILSGTQYTQCADCRRGDSTYFMSLSGLDNDQVQHLKTVPHLNYINIFGDGTIKTGVAAHSRKYKRIREQGATAAIFFTECDGYVARQIERYVSFNLKIRQALTWDTKAGLLLKHLDMQKAQSILMEQYRNVTLILPAEYKQYVKHEHEFFYNSYLSNLKNSLKVDLFNYISQVQPGDTISGNVIGAYGSTILLENEKDLFLTNTNSMLGYVISISEQLEKMQIGKDPKIIGSKKSDTEVLSLF